MYLDIPKAFKIMFTYKQNRIRNMYGEYTEKKKQ